MKKKIIAFLGIIISSLFVLFLLNYIGNEKNIEAYNDGEYKINEASIMDFAEKYVTINNKGNVFYQKKMFKEAEEEYKNALKKHHPSDKDCSIRINLALSIAMAIDPETVDETNLDETIQRLEEAKGYLIENGCAHADDDNGHNKDAQQLKKDIDEFEKELKQTVEEKQKQKETDKNKDGEGDKSQKSDDKTDKKDDKSADADNDDNQKKQEEKLKEQYEKMQREAEKERSTDIPTESGYGSSYSGDVW